MQAYLEDQGQKVTEARFKVLEVFLSIERHLTAEELYREVALVYPGLGQATVFRTIKLLVAAGLAREARSDSGGRQYEHAFKHKHHDHLVCQACGKVVEFSSPELERAQDQVYRSHGFTPLGHRMELYGLCSACKSK